MYMMEIGHVFGNAARSDHYLDRSLRACFVCSRPAGTKARIAPVTQVVVGKRQYCCKELYER